jgi:pyruvate,water dikinase
LEPGSLVDFDYWMSDFPAATVACTRANAADGFPKALTPLTQDLVLTYEEAGVRKFFFDALKVLEAENVPLPYMVGVHGWVYLNADNMAGLGESTPGSSGHTIYQQYLNLQPDPAYVPPARSLKAKLGDAVVGLKTAPRMLRLMRRLPGRLVDQRRAVTDARPAAVDDLTPAEASAWLARLDALQVECWETLMAGAMFGGIFFETVAKALAKSVGEDAADLTNRLHVGLGGNETADAGLAVRRLAALARREGLAGLLGDPAEACAKSPVFAAAVDEVIAEFGHRGPAELELANPTWRSDRSLLFGAVGREASRLDTPPAGQGDDTVRLAAEQELVERLGRVKAAFIKPLVRRSQRLLPIRENGKTPAVTLFDEYRRLLEAVAPTLVERGVLRSEADAVYLRHAELRQVLAGADGPGPDELARRVAAYERCLALQLPELIELRPASVRPLPTEFMVERGLLPPEAETVSDELAGFAVSPGSLTATAWVMHEPDDDFEPGGVLVTHSTDPGWIGVLASAGAVVLDTGGMLCHGAIVARELGIPAVVGVKTAVERITPGSTITVDGSAGVVRL